LAAPKSCPRRREAAPALLACDTFELQHDPQRGRDLGHILLSFGGAVARGVTTQVARRVT